MTDSIANDPDQLREAVRQRYAAAATRVAQEHTTAESALLRVLDISGCCSTADAAGGCGTSSSPRSVSTSDLYAIDEVADLPSAAVLASLGCGNPTALAELKPGETVLDLGSGGGIDVLLSAKRVGPTGFAYGLDMTDEMLAIAEKNRQARGVPNVRFLKGHIEQIPLPDDSVDVIILSPLRLMTQLEPKVLREAFRVLKPGGRFAVSDVVVQGDLPAGLRESMELWAGCIAGALEESTYRQLLAEAGFRDVGVEVTRVYDAQDLAGSKCCGDSPATRAGFSDLTASGGRLVSAFIRATKPVQEQHAALSQKPEGAPTEPILQTDCCSTAEQSTCCEPADKDTCCGTPAAAATSSACGAADHSAVRRGRHRRRSGRPDRRVPPATEWPPLRDPPGRSGRGRLLARLLRQPDPLLWEGQARQRGVAGG
jgi:arsenite methyltransferase